MLNIVIIGLGGFLGAISRFLVAGIVQDWSGSIAFPYGTLVVNLTGCLLIGFLSEMAAAYGFFSPQTRLFLMVGFLGSFTTFSTFENEALFLVKSGDTTLALVDLAVHVLSGLAAVWFGQTLAHLIWR
ncbi:MAG: fluoride efflux transporter CrcB [Caldilineales bacterium]|nr:fluoride efflux transporter CrcB [Caldilineales bacterium]